MSPSICLPVGVPRLIAKNSSALAVAFGSFFIVTNTRLAKALGVSIDELVFEKAAGVAASKLMDRELLEQFEMVSALDEDEREAVKKILEGVIVKHQVNKMMRPKPEKSWSQRFREITDRLAKGTKDYSEEEVEQVIDEAVAAVRSKAHAHN